MKNIIATVLLCTLFMHGKGQNKEDFNKSHPNVHKMVVNDVLQTTSYTYLQAEENGKLQWLAIPKMEAAKGETYYYQGGMEMVDFKSTELNRTFNSVLFLDGVINPDIVEGGKTSLNGSTQKSKTVEVKIQIDIKPVAGGITIAELFSNKEKYANKVVKMRGKVTKFNSNIMNKNWIHLQDGTSSSGNFDFTAITGEVVKVDDIITIEGKIALNRDFGAGYFYNVIMENGKVTK